MTTLPTATPKPELAAGNSVSAIVPRDVEQAFRMAQLVVHAQMAPAGLQTPEKVVTAIMHGMEVGLKPMQALQSIAIVNGRPTIWGDAALGLVQGSGLAEWVTERIEGEGDDMEAICEAKRLGWPSPTVGRFSVADAKLAGLWTKAGPWKQYPRRMLQMRARAFALRDAFADVLKGLSVREEVRDFVMARDVTPAPARDLAAEIAAQSAPESHEDAPPAKTRHDIILADAAAPDAPQDDDPAINVEYVRSDGTVDDVPLDEGIRKLRAAWRKADTETWGRMWLGNREWLEEHAPDVAQELSVRVEG